MNARPRIPWIVIGILVVASSARHVPPGGHEVVDNCVLEQHGYPTIDLNTLSLSEPDDYYTMRAAEYDYILNVCRTLNFKDGVCQGAAICQQHHSGDSDKGSHSQVLAYPASTKLRWSNVDQGFYDIESNVIMEMTGTACAATYNATTAKTTIEFVCAQTHHLELVEESSDDCTLKFKFYTAKACGEPRYECYDGLTCIAESDFSGEHANFDACAAVCGGSHQFYV